MTTHEDNVELWERTRDPNEMLLANMGLVYLLANKHAQRLQRGRLTEDYVQAACIGFLNAFKSSDWDPQRGHIGTFVSMWVLSAMQQSVDRDAWYGFRAKSDMVHGMQEIPMHMRDVRSFEAPFRYGDEDGKQTLADVTQDPKWEAGYHEVEKAEDFRLKLATLVAAVDEAGNLEGQWLVDYWVAATEDDTNLMNRLAAKWGVSRQTVANRMAAMRDLLREKFPDLVVGEPRHYRYRQPSVTLAQQ